jgi:hypothetical protein
VSERAAGDIGEDLLDDSVSRCCPSTGTSSNGESVKTAWER